MTTDKEKSDIFMRAAANHLSRVGLLADTEWKVAIAFWAAILASGTALIGAVAGNDIDIARTFYRFSAPVLCGYILSVYLFVFGFSRNQAQSIKTERSRFLYYQSRALAIIEKDRKSIRNSKSLGIPGTASWSEVQKSPVWANKLLNSTAMIGAIWSLAVIIAGTRTARWDAGLDIVAVGNYSLAIIVACVWGAVVEQFYRDAHATRSGSAQKDKSEPLPESKKGGDPSTGSPPS